MRTPNTPTRREFNKTVAAVLALPVATRLAFADTPPNNPPATGPAAPPMLRRKAGRADETLPVVGMGTWQTFDPRVVDDETLAPLREVLKTFHDAGGRVVDSSPMYGKSQAVAGQLARELGISDDLFVATKVWTTGDTAGQQQMEQSLKELGRDKIELMQVHNLLDWKTQLDTLRAWKDRGTFRYIGVTHYQSSAFGDLEQIIKTEKIDFVQLPYSIAVRAAEERLLPAARDAGVGVLVMRPFEGGNLFRKLMGQPLPDVAKGYADSWAQLFLKWVIAHPAVTAVLPATSKPKHMADNVLAGFGPLPDEALRAAWSKSVS